MTEREQSGESRGPGLPEIDVLERGGKKDGEQQTMDQRLYMQLLAFDVPADRDPDAPSAALSRALESAGLAGVVYDDVNAPRGLALLTWSDDPSHFVRAVRPLFRERELAALVPRPAFTMLGRTYSSGHEPDLPFWLLERAPDHVTRKEWPWAVWYPLRRSGAFAKLARQEQVGILREHASIGMAYGQRDLAHDVRLACHGLDSNDNEFVIGLVGKDLHPLSHIVQSMRSTRQTSEYISQMGPFFVGHARWQSRGAR